MEKPRSCPLALASVCAPKTSSGSLLELLGAMTPVAVLLPSGAITTVAFGLPPTAMIAKPLCLPPMLLTSALPLALT